MEYSEIANLIHRFLLGELFHTYHHFPNVGSLKKRSPSLMIQLSKTLFSRDRNSSEQKTESLRPCCIGDIVLLLRDL